MHVFNNADDAKLAERWGLADKGFDMSDPSRAGQAFIVNDCKARGQ